MVMYRNCQLRIVVWRVRRDRSTGGVRVHCEYETGRDWDMIRQNYGSVKCRCRQGRC